MATAPIFLVIDDHQESRYLLVKTLLRKFPGAEILETDDAGRAVELARGGTLTAIVTHRTAEVSGIELVNQLREANPRLIIVMVSGIDREREALAAGATSFLHYDEWLRIGSIVESHLAPSDGLQPPIGQKALDSYIDR